MNIFPSELPSLLGFDAIVERLSSFCVGKNAKEAALQILPSAKFEILQNQLQEIVEYMTASAGNSITSQSHYPEIEKELNVLRMQDAVLSALQCKQLRKLISLSNELIHFFADKNDLFPQLSKQILPNEEYKLVI